MSQNNANSAEIINENANANSLEIMNAGTQETANSPKESFESVVQTIDYQKKFSESSAEALRLYEENKRLKEELESKAQDTDFLSQKKSQNTDSFYPGFEDLDEEAKNNLIAYTDTVTRRAKEEIYKDPAIAFAKSQYNEQRWDSALNKVTAQFPDLAEARSDFKSKYYNPSNVPENIENILTDIAKIYLFDKAKEIGAKELQDKSERVDLERNTAGARESIATRTLEDWNRMAQENPTKFRTLSKEFNDDLKSGKI